MKILIQEGPAFWKVRLSWNNNSDFFLWAFRFIDSCGKLGKRTADGLLGVSTLKIHLKIIDLPPKSTKKTPGIDPKTQLLILGPFPQMEITCLLLSVPRDSSTNSSPHQQHKLCNIRIHLFHLNSTTTATRDQFLMTVLQSDQRHEKKWTIKICYNT